MIKKLFVILFFLSYTGCTSFKVSHPDIKPLPYNSKFIISIYDWDSKNELTFRCPIDKEDITDILKVFYKKNPSYDYQKEPPKYIFHINYIGSAYRHLHILAAKGHYATAFSLIVKDLSGKEIHKNIFKFYRLQIKNWEMSHCDTHRKDIPKALSHILAYISRGDFLTSKSGQVYHGTIGKTPIYEAFSYEDIVKYDHSKKNYRLDLRSANFLYFYYIMGEDINLENLKAIKSFYHPQIDILLLVAKAAKINDWLYFPENLDVSTIKLNFDSYISFRNI